MGKGLAVLTMDDDYVDRFRSRPLGNRQRVVAGFHNLQAGVKDGVIGALLLPSHHFPTHPPPLSGNLRIL